MSDNGGQREIWGSKMPSEIQRSHETDDNLTRGSNEGEAVILLASFSSLSPRILHSALKEAERDVQFETLRPACCLVGLPKAQQYCGIAGCDRCIHGWFGQVGGLASFAPAGCCACRWVCGSRKPKI